MNYLRFAISIFIISLSTSCINSDVVIQNKNLDRATKTLDAIYSHYTVDNDVLLLRENYPYDEKWSRPYSFLWTYSGSIPALIALYESSKDTRYLDDPEGKILPGLDLYYDTTRLPNVYSSYLNSEPQSDRFFDDNLRLGMDFVDLYTLTQKPNYLDKAKAIWQFVETGVDSSQGKSVYWF